MRREKFLKQGEEIRPNCSVIHDVAFALDRLHLNANVCFILSTLVIRAKIQDVFWTRILAFHLKAAKTKSRMILRLCQIFPWGEEYMEEPSGRNITLGKNGKEQTLEPVVWHGSHPSWQEGLWPQTAVAGPLGEDFAAALRLHQRHPSAPQEEEYFR